MAAKTTTKTTTATKTTKPVAKKASPKKATGKYNVLGYAGLARSVISRETGTRINIWLNAEAKRDDHGGTKPWAVECEDHNVTLATATRTEADRGALDVTSFCPKCKAAAKRNGKAA